MSKCSVLVIACMDYRVQSKVKDVLKALGLDEPYDYIAVAGGPQTIVNPATRSWLTMMMRVAIEKHGVNKVVLLAHQDCAMYGGSKMFAGWKEEEAAYAADLEKAAGCVCATFPGVSVSKHVLVLASADVVTTRKTTKI